MIEYDRKIKKQLKTLKPEIESWLKQTVSEKRFEHIARVAKTAKKYAKKLGLDHYKAELSSWLHDCAKEFPNEKLLEIAKEKNIEMDEIDYIHPHVLHARVSALIAKEKFAIDDPDVLGGIRCHTLAEPNMSKITMVVYLADATEPGRDRRFAAPIRKTFKHKGLEHAVLQAIDGKLSEVIEKKKPIHPLTIKARNWLLGIL
ncbi:MAG: bis(5'-nucleosyl)-tetraphosphatase (symmetrical) YqeK [Candidatus Melainabacteria bacterium]|nr:bis(5'-nucleosyl)-tetraphosphatase (symmetrical) YqeK [Candidatus Melainabacteria bacterium]